jgi:DNA-binding transcriptional MerR regulator
VSGAAMVATAERADETPVTKPADAKAPDAFRTISEVADDLDVPQHVLRFWETRFPQIRPLKRGGGRRYYRRDDVALVRGIRHLLYGQGYTIRGVQRILKAEGVRFVQAVGRGEIEAAAFVGGRDEDGPPEETAPAATDEPGLTPAARDRLAAVLDDLRECARVLAAARAGDGEP